MFCASGSQLGGDFHPTGQMAMSGDIFGVTTEGWVTTDLSGVLTMHRTAPHSKEFSGPKCQQG